VRQSNFDQHVKAEITRLDHLAVDSERSTGERTLPQLTEDHPEAVSASQQLAKELRLGETMASVRDVRNAVSDIRSAVTLTKRIRTLYAVSPAVRRSLLVVPALIVVAGAAIAVPLYLAGHATAALVAPFVSLVTAAVSGAGEGARKASRIIRAGTELIDVDHRDEQAAVARATADAEEARRNLRRAVDSLADLQKLDATGIYRFVSERYAAPEYARYMGVVSLLEQDLQALSRMLTTGGPGRPTERGGRQMHVDRTWLCIRVRRRS
jgi:hypothetical protein